MEIRPFHAWRYSAEAVGEFAAVVAPPYDVIDDAHRDALYERSPYNVVRLILGREADRYASAHECMEEWMSKGILRRDPEPAAYLYAQAFDLEGRKHERIGLIGAMRLEPFSTGRIRPHEKTLAGPKADRLRLMEATGANLSPIFSLYAGRSAVLEETRSQALDTEPLADVTDEFGVRHRLWSVVDSDALGRIAADLAPRTVYIADGHHRYETALAYRDQLAARGALPDDAPARFIMMFLCSTTDPDVAILPTHRVLSRLPGFHATRFLDGLREVFDVRPFPNTDEGARAFLAELRSCDRPGRFGIAARGAGSLYLALQSDPALMDRIAADVAPAVRRLDVTALDRVVLRGALGLDAAQAAHEGKLRYVKDAAEALALVRAGRADVACLLNATRMEEVVAVCDSGETMPEKSTYFHPKLGTGFVFHLLR